MVSGSGATGDEPPVRISDTIGAVSRRIIDSVNASLPVVDDDGMVVGHLPRTAALEVLLQEASDV